MLSRGRRTRVRHRRRRDLRRSPALRRRVRDHRGRPRRRRRHASSRRGIAERSTSVAREEHVADDGTRFAFIHVPAMAAPRLSGASSPPLGPSRAPRPRCRSRTGSSADGPSTSTRVASPGRTTTSTSLSGSTMFHASWSFSTGAGWIHAPEPDEDGGTGLRARRRSPRIDLPRSPDDGRVVIASARLRGCVARRRFRGRGAVAGRLSARVVDAWRRCARQVVPARRPG